MFKSEPRGSRNRWSRTLYSLFGRIDSSFNDEHLDYCHRNHRERDRSMVMSDQDFSLDVAKTFSEAVTVLLQKHEDYGPKNIALSPGGPLNGLRVRMWDKIARINHLIDSGADPKNESLRDSFLDLANYSIIAMMVIDGKWPNE